MKLRDSDVFVTCEVRLGKRESSFSLSLNSSVTWDESEQEFSVPWHWHPECQGVQSRQDGERHPSAATCTENCGGIR